jgi:hypothetical protein
LLAALGFALTLDEAIAEAVAELELTALTLVRRSDSTRDRG